jgi:FSR family fosmidomycin resistance protein-like MFS transporter
MSSQPGEGLSDRPGDPGGTSDVPGLSDNGAAADVGRPAPAIKRATFGGGALALETAANPQATATAEPAGLDAPEAIRAGGSVHPMLTLWLLSLAHAVNHAQAALLPLVYLPVIVELHVGVEAIAFLTAAGSFASGMVQLVYSAITRYTSRRAVLVAGNLVFGGGMAAQALAGSFLGFSLANVVSRIGTSPQHPVGNALLAEQFPTHRRGFAISAHIAGGNLGTIAIPLLGTWLIAGYGWRWTVVLFGVPAILVGLAMLVLIRETGADRAAALARGSLRSGFRSILRDRDMLWLFAATTLAAGARGLGTLNLFVPLYLALIVHLDQQTVGIMYTALLVGSVPGPLVAGWLSDRIGRKPVILAVYVAGAAAIAIFVMAGTSTIWLWLGVILMSAFSFVESPQLQSLLADISPAGLRDTAFATYYTLAFGIGSLWVAIFGVVIDSAGEQAGLPLVFWAMAATFVLAALAVLPIHADERAAAMAGSER